MRFCSQRLQSLEEKMKISDTSKYFPSQVFEYLSDSSKYFQMQPQKENEHFSIIFLDHSS